MNVDLRQIVVIGGGDTFDTYEQYFDSLRSTEPTIEWFTSTNVGWKKNLRSDLNLELGENCPNTWQVLIPEMPNKLNAKYDEWKIWFEKVIPFLHDDCVLIGHSLGASFFVKFLSENKLEVSIKALFLVSGVYFDPNIFGFLPPKNPTLPLQNIFFYHSSDDAVVPVSETKKFAQFFPNSHQKFFTDRGHFNGEHFPELVADIENLW